MISLFLFYNHRAEERRFRGRGQGSKFIQIKCVCTHLSLTRLLLQLCLSSESCPNTVVSKWLWLILHRAALLKFIKTKLYACRGCFHIIWRVNTEKAQTARDITSRFSHRRLLFPFSALKIFLSVVCTFSLRYKYLVCSLHYICLL